jgi:acyl-CoA synthetase (AMP-forming)/AMP-acid ligase II
MLTGDMLRRSAERFPNKPAIVWQGLSLTYRDLNAHANQLAHALLGLGLKKGAKVAVLSRNVPEYGVIFFGVARTGFILVNVSILYASEELAYVLDKSDAEVLVHEDAFAEKVASVLHRLPKLKHRIVIGTPQAGEPSFREFLARQPDIIADVSIQEDDPFSMTYTGGTTGRPKGVLASHRSRAITAHTVMVEEALDERDVVGIVTPLFHVAALNIMFQPAVLAGATSTFLSKWDVGEFVRMAHDTRMSAAFMVPTQIAMVISDPGFEAAHFSAWRKLSFAGAPMPDWVQLAMMEKLPAVKLTQIYGQSEMGVLTSLRYWHLPDKLGSVGRQAYNVDVAVVDPNGQRVGAGEIGEVVSRGENVMLEYYNEPEQTKAFWRDGWAWTGDLATIDQDGFITLVDRSKDMIISGGENIWAGALRSS